MDRLHGSTASLKDDKNKTRIWMMAAAGGDAIPMTSDEIHRSIRAGARTENISHFFPNAMKVRLKSGCWTAGAEKPNRSPKPFKT